MSSTIRHASRRLLAGGLAALTLLLAAPADAAPQEGRSHERPGTGEPVCGLGKAFHAGRRAALRAAVGEGLMLFRGLPATRGYVRFSQDKVFWYLTGIESPDATLLMDAKSGDEILFLPAPDATKEGWEGEQWDSGDAWVRELTGFDDVRPEKQLLGVLRERLGSQRKVWISTEPHVELAGCHDRAIPDDRQRAKDPLDGRPSREEALRAALEKLGAEVLDTTPKIDELRRVKQPEEVSAMRRAGRSGALAMVEAMRSSRPGIGEWDLEAAMDLVQVREGAAGPAYHAIVGSGPNSNVLHYSASGRTLRAGEIVLIDYGPEVDHYTTDITRTWPVDGKWTPRMTELYDAVLAAQQAGIAAVKPGRTMREIEKVCADSLREAGFGDLIRHGSCHYIGLEVHDVGDGRAPFVPGVAFTVEPGLYDEEAGIGIRIEDVVVVTADGCEVVTADVPKDRATISALVAEAGVLDRMDSAGE